MTPVSIGRWTIRLRRSGRAFTKISSTIGILTATTGVACTESSKPTLRWDACDSGQCASLEVPVDYAAPNGEKIELSLYRAPASSGPGREPLVYVPGGPGVPVVEFGKSIQASIRSALPSFDLVLMDPRGVGQSAPIDCMDATFLDHGSPLNVSLTLDDDIAREVKELSEFWSAFERRCRDQLGKDRLRNYHSENVARDLDRVREALGARRIHVWAASYGTLASTLYAKLFPRGVGAFVLSGPVLRGSDNRIDDVNAIMAAHEVELGRMLDWCAATARCGLGDRRDEVRERYDRLRRDLQDGVRFGGSTVPPASLTRAVVFWLEGGEWNEIASALRAATADNWGPILRRATADPYFDEESDQLAYWQASAVLQLLDFGCPPHYSAARAEADVVRALKRFPRTGELFAPLHASCVGWKARARGPRVVPENLDAPPLLLLAGEHDPATPAERARSLLRQLNNDSEILFADVEGHVVARDDAMTRQALRFIENSAE